MVHSKTPFVKLADGRIANFIESINQKQIVIVPQDEAVSNGLHYRTDVVQMEDGTFVSELETIIANMGGGGGGNITIDNVIGLRDSLNTKGDNLGLTDDKLSLNQGNNELSNVPMITSAEISLILDGLV